MVLTGHYLYRREASSTATGDKGDSRRDKGEGGGSCKRGGGGP
jgi:hypothetical protein